MDDLAMPQHHRSGAHRARRHPLLVLLLALGAVGLLSAVLLWALLTLDVLGVGDELRQVGGAASVEPPAASTAVASAGASEEPEDGADRSAPLDVFNSTATPGLAGTAAAELEELGWSTGQVGNHDGDETPTTVLYPEQSQQTTAEAVVDELGVGTATASSDVAVITVVLGPDYAG